MKPEFRDRIRSALADPFLQRSLDRNADRRQASREEALRELPDAGALRRRARQVRQDVIRRLPQLVDEFADRLQANGYQVHMASSGQEAAQQVVAIAQASGASLVAKSKSMVTEEIELNHALDSAGMQALETDLGEFIVQLRGEPPAHIITPAVHLSTQQVAETFHARLGTPETADVAALTAAARAHLRSSFLKAEVGVSGVNFGVVETGSLCLVTNEGNGRMVTTLPPVHIAVMGVERLVPTLEDLALMLQLLPRSATGQSLTSYVSLLQAPRRKGEPDGPGARHVVLVDNGRTKVASSDLSEILLCIRCGACLNACPVYREIGGHAYGSVYSGPIGAVLSPALFGTASFGQLAKASTLCGACSEACPVGIDFPTLLLRTRDDTTEAGQDEGIFRAGLRLYSWAATSPARFRAAQVLLSLLSRLAPARAGWIRSLPPPLQGWTRHRDFPRFTQPTFTARVAARISPAGELSLPPGSLDSADTPKEATEPPPTADEELLGVFRRRLEAVDGHVIAVRPGQLNHAIREHLRSIGCYAIGAWGADSLPPGLLDDLRAAGIEIHAPTGDSESNRGTHRAALEQVQIGLTGSTAGLAETGTIVVPSGPGRPLLASLLPPVHLAVLNSRDLYRDMGAWIAGPGRRQIEASSSLTLISGPSRTADIEMTLTIGVHGPGQLIVFCLT